MIDRELHEAIDRAVLAAGRGDHMWNHDFLQALSNEGLKLSTSAADLSDPRYVTAPYPWPEGLQYDWPAAIVYKGEEDAFNTKLGLL